MNRRNFHGLAALGIIGSFLPSQNKPLSNAKIGENSLVKPKRLLPGDKVGLITPGSYIPDAGYEKAVLNL
ncbi:MAG: LD-carboxypeptidase, partial [Bacteroidota bacterium]